MTAYEATLTLTKFNVNSDENDELTESAAITTKL